MKIWAENVRGIQNKVEFDIPLTGLTVIYGENETGKTTISEVLTILAEYKADSNHSMILDLQPKGQDVEVKMGCTLEIENEIYSISKQYVKNYSVTVERISEPRERFNATESNKIIDRIFNEQMDPILRKMLQVGQGSGAEAIKKSFDEPSKNSLRIALMAAVENELVNQDSDFLTKLQSEYFKWFTKSGKMAIAEGTKGSELTLAQDNLKTLRIKLSDYEKQIEDAISTKSKMEDQQLSEQELRRRRDAQILGTAIAAGKNLRDERIEAISELNTFLSQNPTISNFNQDIYEEARNLQHFETSYNSLPTLKISALKQLRVIVGDHIEDLQEGSIYEPKIEEYKPIQIGDLALVQFRSGESGNNEGIAEGYALFREKMRVLCVENLRQAGAINSLYIQYLGLKQDVDHLLSIKTLEHSEADLLILESKAQAFSENFEALKNYPEVTEEDINRINREAGIHEGKWEIISKLGLHELAIGLANQITDLNARIISLENEASSIKLLKDTIDSNKQKEEASYAKHFQDSINLLVKDFLGKDAEIRISEDFSILGRYFKGNMVEISQLSMGAREQISVLMRIALSRMIQKNQSVPIFFDDEFGHSDPERIKAMSIIFDKYTQDQQFILTTCYPEKFADFKVNAKLSM
jgi:energy-coupling factor transporter ATP-binding protein EcfA2